MSDTPPKHYGLAAVGGTTNFDVEVVVACDDPNDVHIEINARGWSFRFRLSTCADVPRLLSFLREHTGTTVYSELVVGTLLDRPVSLVKDDEFADRFWLRAVGPVEMVEFMLAGDDLVEFTDAVTQAVEDLQS